MLVRLINLLVLVLYIGLYIAYRIYMGVSMTTVRTQKVTICIKYYFPYSLWKLVKLGKEWIEN